jgi:hypothetical protein
MASDELMVPAQAMDDAIGRGLALADIIDRVDAILATVQELPERYDWYVIGVAHKAAVASAREVLAEAWREDV